MISTSLQGRATPKFQSAGHKPDDTDEGGMMTTVRRTFLPLVLVCLFPIASVAQEFVLDFGAGQLTQIGVDLGGNMYVKAITTPTLPSTGPGPCTGTNNGFVAIPAANDAMKSLALSIYFSAQPGTFHAQGCLGPLATQYGVVTQLYSHR